MAASWNIRGEEDEERGIALPSNAKASGAVKRTNTRRRVRITRETEGEKEEKIRREEREACGDGIPRPPMPVVAPIIPDDAVVVIFTVFAVVAVVAGDAVVAVVAPTLAPGCLSLPLSPQDKQTSPMTWFISERDWRV